MLVVVLVFLILISLVTALAVQRSISGEQVSKALKTQAVAFQAAETALRYCEDQLLRTSSLPSGSGRAAPQAVGPDGKAPVLWMARDEWKRTTGKAVEVGTALVNSTDAAARKLEVLPQCMAERIDLPGDGARREAFLVTAVGYSPDFRTTAGRPESGGEVWLQSVVTPRR
ncbi:MAG: hypothetical protein WKG52_04335 [Variovorax sp.]